MMIVTMITTMVRDGEEDDGENYDDGIDDDYNENDDDDGYDVEENEDGVHNRLI